MKGKTKNKELKKFSDEELLAEIVLRSGSKKGLPIKEKCFYCHRDFWIKWNNATRSNSKVYSWDYLTGEKTKDKVCGQCLRFLWTDPQGSPYREKIIKRRILSAYLTANRI